MKTTAHPSLERTSNSLARQAPVAIVAPRGPSRFRLARIKRWASHLSRVAHEPEGPNLQALLTLVLMVICMASDSNAQTSIGGRPVAGTWLVTVDGIPDGETRTLIIGSEPGLNAAAELAARYGLTSNAQTPVQAKLLQDRMPRQLVVTTQAATVITVDEQPDGSFSGTFLTKNDRRFPVRISRITDAHLADAQAHAATPPAPVQDSLQLPSYRVGDSWEYDFSNRRYAKPGCRYRLTVEQMTKEHILARVEYPDGCEVSIVTAYQVPAGSVQRFDRSLNPFYYSTDAYQLTQLPLAVGKTWSQLWRRNQNGWDYEYQIEASVDARERISVPAGVFDTYRIHLNVSYRGTKIAYITQSGRYEDTLWYASEVNNFVRRVFHDPGWAEIHRELVSYRRAPR